jgi:uncharacterized surface protein with fasciclin (FAS1) repeats
MKYTKISNWLSLLWRDRATGFEVNLQKLTGTIATVGVTLVLGTNMALAYPRTQRSNPYITVWDSPTIGPSRTADGTISGTLNSAVKYGWDFSAIASQFQKMGLSETLSDRDTSDPNAILYTVFVPTNEAWETLDPAIRANSAALENILRYHIVPGSVTQTELESGQIQTLSGGLIAIQRNASNDRFRLNNDVEVTSSIRTQNGVIVFVNKPLVPGQN